MVRLSDILDEDAILFDMNAGRKDEAIAALVQVLEGTRVVSDAEAVVRDIHKRERTMSTGIGGGIAVPHAQSRGAERLALALGRLRRPIEFEALDGRPVQLLFLVVGPEERGGFIRVLARISRLLYSGDLQRNLLRARTPGEAMEFIRMEESRITG
jgi:mannitol/fructose-specific phosphotransferase system IIA component (Ntr-type)